MGVGVVDARRVDLDHLQPVARNRIGKLSDVQDLGSAEFGDLDSAHGRLLGRGVSSAR